MNDPQWLEQWAITFDPVGSWIVVGLVSLLLAVVLFAFPPDPTRIGLGRRLTLVAVRLAAFLALIACMLRPTLVSSRKVRQQGTVLVLADASESMTVADGADGRSRWEQLTATLEAARPAARDLLAEGGFEIAAWTFDRELHPLAATAGDPFPLEGAWSARDTSGETAIGAALEEALRAVAGRQIAGVIVLSDGAQHAYPPRDVPPQTVARGLTDLQAPLWSVTFGQSRAASQGRDAAIVSLAVAETGYLENMLEVAARARFEGLAGQRVAVELLEESEAGGMELVHRQEANVEAESDERPLRFDWTPRRLGERKLAVRVEPQEGEVVVTNNEISTFVNVIDGGLKVLYLEGALRVEQRFLRRVLAASPAIKVDFRWIDSSRRETWPVDLARQLATPYDVYLIGDLDSSALRPQDLETILARVEAGAGIGLLGGFHAFEAGGWGGSKLGPLMPFKPDQLARQSFDEPVRPGNHLPGPVRMRPDPRLGGISILRLGGDDAATRAAWDSLPPLTGATKLGPLVDAAQPLAVADDKEGTPLLVAREFGAGRVAAFAADSTWRWVMQGSAEQHRRFWRQLVLWLARKDDTEADSLWLRLAQRRLPPGTPLEFDAGITTADGQARTDAALEAVVTSPAGRSRPVRVVPSADGFSGTVAQCVEPGDWNLVVRARLPGEPDQRERSARFTVFRQDLELANSPANNELMKQLAEATTGGVRQPEEVPVIFADLATRPATYESREQKSRSLADPAVAWPALMLLATALITEWYLRKRWGLV